MRAPASIKVVVLALAAAWVGVTLALVPTPALRTKENIAPGYGALRWRLQFQQQGRAGALPWRSSLAVEAIAKVISLLA
jgi:hypothetical protein